MKSMRTTTTAVVAALVLAAMVVGGSAFAATYDDHKGHITDVTAACIKTVDGNWRGQAMATMRGYGAGLKDALRLKLYSFLNGVLSETKDSGWLKSRFIQVSGSSIPMAAGTDRFQGKVDSWYMRGILVAQSARLLASNECHAN